jgi:hypothetical protein
MVAVVVVTVAGTAVAAVTETEVVVTAVALAVAMAAVLEAVTRVTAVPITPAALTVAATAMGSPVITPAGPFAIMVKAEITTAMTVIVTAVMARRLQALLTPEILTA